MDINDYLNYKNKTIADFKVAIAETEKSFTECIKNKDAIGALKAYKTKIKLVNLLHKKTHDGTKTNYKGHKKP